MFDAAIRSGFPVYHTNVIMHIGLFDDEPATVAIMDKFFAENGCKNDFSKLRLHHEIYLSDARKVELAKWKTVIRHSVKKL